MTTRAEDEVTAFLTRMAAGSATPDGKLPVRVRRGARRRMTGWGAITAFGVAAVPLLASLADRTVTDLSRGGNAYGTPLRSGASVIGSGLWNTASTLFPWRSFTNAP